MGANNLVTETGPIIQLAHVNKFKTALSGDVLARDASGNVGNNTASLGASATNWLKAFISSGYWSLGDIKMHHSYNATVPIGEGWMLCDGRQVTQAAYDTEHGAGHWATFVGSSGLLNKFLPDFTSRYPTGAATTTETGAGAIASVGRAGNLVSLTHNHTWYVANGAAAADDTFNSSGIAKTIDNTGVFKAAGPDTAINIAAAQVIACDGAGRFYTDQNLSASFSIQPDSIQVQYYMRII